MAFSINVSNENFMDVLEEKDIFTKESPRSRKKIWLHGYCFYCNSFGYKAIDCRSSMLNKTSKLDKFQHIIRNFKKIWRNKEHWSET